MSFTPPINSLKYLLRHGFAMGDLRGSGHYADFDDELMSDIIDGAASFASDVLAPINKSGDECGATIKDGVVTTAPGFKQAYSEYAQAGWQSLAIPQNLGGMGLPSVLSVASNEMLYAANMAFGLCPLLTSGALNAIAAHGSEEIKAKYLANMVSGQWTGGMNLTEPQAGSDLAAIRTKAVPNSDDSYAISGQKIFITWGEHDVAENIIHLVLARLPDAPEGSRGISLFVVPKFFVDEGGNLGDRNQLKAIGLEHKLGIHASPTCVMEFDGAKGWLVGQENKGLACMFTMMNEARLFVGVQGVAVGERAYQAALSYAQDRVQGRTLNGATDAGIAHHPDVRRMLLDMKTGLMAARSITMLTALYADLSQAAGDGDVRKTAHAREGLLTPIAKSFGSDMGEIAASLGVQIHGGMGFIEETGAAQHYRDSRITKIYEGTNGIQAIDLIGRKIRREGGQTMFGLIQDLESKINGLATSPELDDGAKIAVLSGLSTLSQVTKTLLGLDEQQALSCANAYQDLAAEALSTALLYIAACNGAVAKDESAASMAKIVRYVINSRLPMIGALKAQIECKGDRVFDYPYDRLADL